MFKNIQKEQLDSHELQVTQLKHELKEHQKTPVPSKGLPLQNHKEKEAYLQYEVSPDGNSLAELSTNVFIYQLRRYEAYVNILTAKLLTDQQPLELQCQQAAPPTLEEDADTFPVGTGSMPTTPQSINTHQQQQPQPSTNSRYSQQQRARNSSSSGNAQHDIG